MVDYLKALSTTSPWDKQIIFKQVNPHGKLPTSFNFEKLLMCQKESFLKREENQDIHLKLELYG